MKRKLTSAQKKVIILRKQLANTQAKLKRTEKEFRDCSEDYGKLHKKARELMKGVGLHPWEKILLCNECQRILVPVARGIYACPRCLFQERHLTGRISGVAENPNACSDKPADEKKKGVDHV